MVIALKTLISKLSGNKKLLQHTLSSFSCKQDPDIQFFLHYRAVDFESLSKARTYLIVDETALQQGKFIILGYFSLALKILFIPESLSTRARKELDGFSGKLHGEPIQSIPCYLIGQLGRNSDYDKSILSGKSLLTHAYNSITAAAELVGGRYIMAECHNNEKLLHFYQDNLFNEISRTNNHTVTMVQLIRKI